jgi:signal transduction histidine kinase
MLAARRLTLVRQTRRVAPPPPVDYRALLDEALRPAEAPAEAAACEPTGDRGPRSEAERRVPGNGARLVPTAVEIAHWRECEARLRDLSRQLVDAQETERRRIARELHDDVNQRLALLAIAIDQIASSVRDAGVRQSMRELWTQTTEISRSIHNLSHSLHSSTLDALGLVPALRTLSRELSAAGLLVTLDAEDDCRDLTAEAALALFRIVQESLNNVVRHSGVTEACVTVRRLDDTMVVRIEDRGRGFDAATRADGLGLHSIRERLVLIGGAVQVQSRPGEGTVVEARLPRLSADPAVAPVCAA